MSRVVVVSATLAALLTLVPTTSSAQTGFTSSTPIAPPAGSPSIAEDYFDALSCAGAGDCVGLASSVPATYPHSAATSDVTTMTDGSWSQLTSTGLAPDPLSPATGPLASLSCWTSTDCTAVGYPYANAPTIDTETGGIWGGPIAAPYPAASQTDVLHGVWCADAGSCVALGVADYGTYGRFFVDVESSGAWRPSQLLPTPKGAPASASTNEYLWLGSGSPITCTSTGSCTVVGGILIGSRSAAFADEEVDGVWSSPTVMTVRGGSDGQLEAVSCLASGYCAAVGNVLVQGQAEPIGAFRAAGRWHMDGELLPPQFTPSLPAGTLNAVSCVAPVTCVAVGEMTGVESNDGTAPNDPHGHPLAFTLLGSRWSRGQLMPLPRSAGVASGGADLQAVACFTSKHCEALGSSAPTHASRYRYFPPAVPFAMGLTPVARIATPGPPTYLSTMPVLYDGLEVSWGYPRFDGGAPIASFLVAIHSAGHRTLVRRTASLSVSVGGLPAHRLYVVTVRARNLAGRLGTAGRIVFRR